MMLTSGILCCYFVAGLRRFCNFCLFVPQDNMQRYGSPISCQSVTNQGTIMESDVKYFMGIVLLLLTMLLLLLSTSLLADSRAPCNTAAPEQHVSDLAIPGEAVIPVSLFVLSS